MKTPLVFLLCMAGSVFAAEPKAPAPEKIKRQTEIKAYYGAPMRRIAVEIKPEAMEQLRSEPRIYVEMQLKEGETLFKNVALKLKGSEGSFKPIDEKPGMTLNFDKYKGAERFHGQKKLHLNNANEDPSFLREWLAGEMAQAAGVPAGRCTHAMVSINGKDKGLYVVRESFTKDFLAAHFSDSAGGLFEGHFCKDLDLELTLDEGEESARDALKALLAACEAEDAATRWTKLQNVLDVDAYAAHLAFEQAIDFWDSYDFNVNNYRLYVLNGKCRFVLHGMDQILQDPEVSLQRSPKSRVGQAFLSCPPGRALYRKKITELYENVLRKHDWPAVLAERAEVVKAGMQAMGSRKGKEFAQRAEALRADLIRRIDSIGRQLSEWPEPLTFDAKGVAVLRTDWREENENGEAASLGEASADGRAALRVEAKEESSASWRRTVLLDAGKYRFEGTVRARGVEAVDDEKGKGAGLRISGSEQKRENSLDGNSEWTLIGYDFEIDGAREVVLVAELRARKGEAFFARDSLRLVRLK
jgi:spore coat protein H